MGRRNQRSRTAETETENSEMAPTASPNTMAGRAQAGSATSDVLSGSIVSNHSLNVLGVGNARRFFDIGDPTNGPSVVMRHVQPFRSISRGYSASNGPSSQDTTAATDTSAKFDDPLYPITLSARHMSTSVWPVLKNLFFSGTGSRHQITEQEWVRYTAMLLRAYEYMMVPFQVNNLAYHFDWTKVYPFTPDVPQWLYKLAKDLDATDVGIAERWLPLIKRFDTKVAFPRMIDEFKRMSAPMNSVDLNGRLQVPFATKPFETTAEIIEENVDRYLSFLDGPLSPASSLFQTFLPFPFMMSDPWNISEFSALDVNRDSGWFNSGLYIRDAFGDTGDPNNDTNLTFTPDDNRQIIYYSRHVQPTWGEVRLSTIYHEDKNWLDDTFSQLTFHHHANIQIPDDFGDFLEYDHTTGQSPNEARYQDFANCRYAVSYQPRPKWGIMKPGYMGASIPEESVERLVRQDVDFIFNVDLLKQIMIEMTGASLRELRDVIRRSVYAGVRSDT